MSTTAPSIACSTPCSSGFQESDARDARLEASLSKQLLIAVGIVLTGLAIATGIIVALFIQYVG